MLAVTALTYPQIVGSFAQGAPGASSYSITGLEGDRRLVDFSTQPVGSFANGYPLPDRGSPDGS